MPTNKGIAADHVLVPEAVPEPPVEVVHLTDVTATLSEAVPLNAMDAAEVDAIVRDGALICIVGDVVSLPAGGFGGGTGAGGVGTGGGVGITGGCPGVMGG